MQEVSTSLSTPPSRLIFTFKQFVTRHPCVKKGGLRFQIFQAKKNGLEESGALLRIGRKILIDEPKYFGWIDDLQDKETGPLRDKLTQSKKRVEKGKVKLSSNPAEAETEMEDAENER